eukprot:XP_011672446.1 PREDICTED: persulfide dioxygenase ETHE1, mitochondrial [Strongylocentrotus purpuratus]
MSSFGLGLRLSKVTVELAAGIARRNQTVKSGAVSLACSRLQHVDQSQSLHTLSAHTPARSRSRLLQEYNNTSCNLVNFVRNMSAETLPDPSNLIFRQLFDYQSYTYTYLLADKDTKDAILIDPVIELVKRDLHLVEDLGLNLIYAVNTHCHADHITGSGLLKEKLPNCKSIISGNSGAKADLYIDEGDQIKFGNLALEVLSTPGHTSGCVTYVLRNETGTPCDSGMLYDNVHGKILSLPPTTRLMPAHDYTGDSGMLYDNVHGKILSLPPTTRLMPAHDYTGQTVTTVKEELQFNPRLTKTKEEFIKIMQELNLPYPKAIDKALPANLVCGIVGEGYDK